MKIKFEKRLLDDGRMRPVLMYKKHWWSAWKPFLDKEGYYIVNWGYLSDSEEDILSKMQLHEGLVKNWDVRLSMLDMVIRADEVYVGSYSNFEGYNIAYDATCTERVEDLQNLEIAGG